MAHQQLASRISDGKRADVAAGGRDSQGACTGTVYMTSGGET